MWLLFGLCLHVENCFSHSKDGFGSRRKVYLCTGFALSNEANRVPSLGIGSKPSALLERQITGEQRRNLNSKTELDSWY